MSQCRSITPAENQGPVRFGFLCHGKNHQLVPASTHFIFFKRRQLHLGLARVGPMHGLAVMAERFLGKSFRIPANFGPFRPCVSVGMQRNAFNSHPAADDLEPAGPMLFIHRGKAWK